MRRGHVGCSRELQARLSCTLLRSCCFECHPSCQLRGSTLPCSMVRQHRLCRCVPGPLSLHGKRVASLCQPASLPPRSTSWRASSASAATCRCWKRSRLSRVRVCNTWVLCVGRSRLCGVRVVQGWACAWNEAGMSGVCVQRKGSCLSGALTSQWHHCSGPPAHACRCHDTCSRCMPSGVQAHLDLLSPLLPSPVLQPEPAQRRIRTRRC